MWLAFGYWQLGLSCLTSFLMFMVCGMVSAFPSPAFPDINSGHYGFKLTIEQMSWLASFTGLFATPGSLLAAPIMDKFGRKSLMIITILPLAVGWLLVVSSVHVVILMVGRIILGIAYGMMCNGTINYLSEISPEQLRGRIVTLNFLFFFAGGFLVNLLGAVINFKWIAVCCLCCVAVASFALVFMYETPRWLLSNQHPEAAEEVVRHLWLFKDPDVIKEKMYSIAVTNTAHLSTKTFLNGLAKLVQPPLWKPFVISQLLMFFQMFTGFCYVINYTVIIFKDASRGSIGNDEFFRNPHYQACLIFVGNMLSCVTAMFFIDNLGRRPMLIVTQLTTALSLTAVGAYYYILQVDPQFATRFLFWLPVTALFIFIFSFSLCLTSLPSLLANELFPTEVRAVSSGMSSLSHNFLYFVIVKTFPLMTDVPMFGIFWIFAFISFIGVVFVVVFVPETKGRTLEDLQSDWYSVDQTAVNIQVISVFKTSEI